jgi:hypothetical protein
MKDWNKNSINKCILIGGVALSYYVKPRTTQDIDVLFLYKEDIPNEINKFKRTRNGAFQHNKTHVEVEVVTPNMINIPFNVAQKIFDTSLKNNNQISIASPSGLVVSKLFRFNFIDMGDIQNLILSHQIDISEFELEQHYIDRFNFVKNQNLQNNVKSFESFVNDYNKLKNSNYFE